MHEFPHDRSTVLKLLDGGFSGEERRRVVAWLEGDPEARRWLRDEAEVAVGVADLERIAAGALERSDRGEIAEWGRSGRGSWWIPWRPLVWAGGLLALGLVVFLAFLSGRGPQLEGTIVGLSGPVRVFGAGGLAEENVVEGMRLGRGDMLETLSVESVLVVRLDDGTHLVLAGRSTVRILGRAGAGGVYFRSGHLWVDALRRRGEGMLLIRTDQADYRTERARFELESEDLAMVLRVADGTVRALRLVDGETAETLGGHFLKLAGDGGEAMEPVPLETPVNHWDSGSLTDPTMVLGKWVGGSGSGAVRVMLVPLPITSPNEQPRTIHAASFCVQRSSERPVVLVAGSRIRIVFEQGAERRFHVGVSAKMPGGFFDRKFVARVEPGDRRRVGDGWEVVIPVERLGVGFPGRGPVGRIVTSVFLYSDAGDPGVVVRDVEVQPPDSGALSPGSER